MQDVAERERLLEELVRARQDLDAERKTRVESEALLAGISRMAAARTFPELGTQLVRTAGAMFECTEIGVLVRDEQGVFQARASIGTVFADSRWTPGTLFERVAKGQPAALFDISSVPEWQEQPSHKRERVASSLFVPLTTRRSVAILAAATDLPSYFSPRHIELGRRIVSLVNPFAQGIEVKMMERERSAAEERALALEEQRATLQEQLETIQRQQEQIAQLVAPTIPVWPGVLLMPFVGSLEAEEAEIATERVLKAMSTQKAGEVLVDLTGLDRADEKLASRLGQLVSAIHLMGGRCRISGVRPEMARILADLQVDHGQLQTALTLGHSLHQALGRLGFEVRVRD